MTKEFPHIFLTRHCKTEWNRGWRLQGTIDLPLSEEGRAEAIVNAEKIRLLNIDRIVTSPSTRAQETAAIYGEALQAPIVVHRGFRELDHGEWEGKHFSELLADPKQTFQKWLDNPTLYDIPGSLETIHSAQERIVNALQEIITQYHDCTILIVTHKHIRALLRCALYRLPLTHFQHKIDSLRLPIRIPQRLLENLRGVLEDSR